MQERNFEAMKKFLIVFLCIAMMLSSLSVVSIAEVTGNTVTDWLHDTVYGLDINIGTYPNVGSINYKTDSYDVQVTKANDYADGLVESAKEAGAGFLMVSIGQNGGTYLAPSAVYNEITGYAPGEKTPDPDSTKAVDFLMVLGQKLKDNGMKMMFYVPSNPPEDDQVARAAFGYEGSGNSVTNATTIEKWGKVIADWGTHYGDLLAGFWFDGVSKADPYLTGEIDGKLPIEYYKECVKTGYADRIFCMNTGPVKPGKEIRKAFDQEDYCAGEADELKYVPSSRWVTHSVTGQDDSIGIQWCLYGYLGLAWNSKILDYSEQYVVDYINSVAKGGGALILNVGVEDGKIASDFVEVLKKARAVLNGESNEVYTFLNNKELEEETYVTSTSEIQKITDINEGFWNSSYTLYNKFSGIMYDGVYTVDDDSEISVYFNGTGVSWIGKKMYQLGTVDVYVDEFYRATVDCSAFEDEDEHNVYLFEETGLTAGTHKLTLALRSGAQLFIDAIGVQDYEPATKEQAEKLEASWVKQSKSNKDSNKKSPITGVVFPIAIAIVCVIAAGFVIVMNANKKRRCEK